LDGNLKGDPANRDVIVFLSRAALKTSIAVTLAKWAANEPLDSGASEETQSGSAFVSTG
jgi:hypothetical protein